MWMAPTIVLRSPATGCCRASSLQRRGLSPTTHDRDVFVVGDDLFGQRQVGVEQSARRVLHCLRGEPAHLGELRAQVRQLLVVGGAHPHEVPAVEHFKRVCW